MATVFLTEDRWSRSSSIKYDFNNIKQKHKHVRNVYVCKVPFCDRSRWISEVIQSAVRDDPPSFSVSAAELQFFFFFYRTGNWLMVFFSTASSPSKQPCNQQDRFLGRKTALPNKMVTRTSLHRQWRSHPASQTFLNKMQLQWRLVFKFHFNVKNTTTHRFMSTCTLCNLPDWGWLNSC